MEIYDSATCLKYQRDNKLPSDWMDVAKDTCLSCIHTLKVRNQENDDMDIIPCGNPEPNQQLEVVP